ncbi:MAG TPA: hypothetical protein VMJ34_05530 [Bryobacteraceae bacterium]|nr:hypothetical protein [Bryobacteraceae bacterium]
MLLSVLLMALNPMIFDYLSEARGYSLALGFYLFALLFCGRSLIDPAELRPPLLVGAGVAMGLSVAANLTFAIPIVALDVLWIAAATGRSVRFPWRAVGRLLLPEMAVAGLILGGSLLHANRHEIAGGLDSLAETLNNFAISCVVHDFDGGVLGTLLNSWAWDWLYPALRLAMLTTVGLVGFYFVRRLRKRFLGSGAPIFAVSASGIWLYLCGGSLLFTIGALLTAHGFAAVPYPLARMVIYCWPLLVIAMCVFIGRLCSGNAAAKGVAAAYLVICSVMVIQCVLQINIDHFGWLGYSSGTREIANVIRKRRLPAGHGVAITTSGTLYQCLDFYRSMYAEKDWKLSVYSAPAMQSDYLVLDRFDAPKGIPPGFRTIWGDPRSGAIVAVPVIGNAGAERESAP